MKTSTEKLTEYEITRYRRQMMIPGWGEEGQRRLKASTVFIAGAGGLGSPVSIYLAVAGVGELRICDSDTTELSNLNRQILYGDASLGRPKIDSARETLQALNSTIHIMTYRDRLGNRNLEETVGRPDIIVDCLDNFETRYLLNAYSVRTGIPLVHAAVWGMSGQITFLHPPATPCLRCILPEAPPPQTTPVVGVTPGLAGCIQSMEVVKYLTGVGVNLKGRLLVFDGEEMTFDLLEVRPRPSCPDCGALS